MAQDRSAYYQQLYETDPILQEAVQRYREYGSDPSAWATQFGDTPAGPGVAAGSGPQAWFQATVKRRMKELGADDAGDYDYNISTGEVSRAGALSRNADWIIPAAATGLAAGPALAGGVGAGSVGGGGAGAAGAGTGVGTGTGVGAGGAGVGAGAGIGGAGAGAGAGAGGGFLGTLGTIGGAASDLVPVLTGMLTNRQAGLAVDARNAYNTASLGLQQNRAEQDRFNTAQDLPGKRLSEGLRASIAANWTSPTTTYAAPGQASKGVRPVTTGGYADPNLISPSARQLANDVLAQELQQQLNRQEPPPITPINANALNPQGNGLDTGLGAANTGLSIWAALAPWLRRGRGFTGNRGDPSLPGGQQGPF